MKTSTNEPSEPYRSPLDPLPLSPKHRLCRALGVATALGDVILADAAEYSKHLATRADVASMLGDEIATVIRQLDEGGAS